MVVWVLGLGNKEKNNHKYIIVIINKQKLKNREIYGFKIQLKAPLTKQNSS